MSPFCPSVPFTRADQRPPLNSFASLCGLLFLSPNFLSTIGLLPPPGFLPLLTQVASYNKGRNHTCSPRLRLCGRAQRPPSFTEFSGFVLSALAMENLCLCIWGGGPCPCLTPPSPPLYSPVPSLFWWSWGLLLPSPTTPPKICECASVRGRSSP